MKAAGQSEVRGRGFATAGLDAAPPILQALTPIMDARLQNRAPGWIPLCSLANHMRGLLRGRNIAARQRDQRRGGQGLRP